MMKNNFNAFFDRLPVILSVGEQFYNSSHGDQAKPGDAAHSLATVDLRSAAANSTYRARSPGRG